MPTNAESSRTGAGGDTQKHRDEGWEDRLRRVGDARFVEVEWSERDSPHWPLPRTAPKAP